MEFRPYAVSLGGNQEGLTSSHSVMGIISLPILLVSFRVLERASTKDTTFKLNLCKKKQTVPTPKNSWWLSYSSQSSRGPPIPYIHSQTTHRTLNSVTSRMQGWGGTCYTFLVCEAQGPAQAASWSPLRRSVPLVLLHQRCPLLQYCPLGSWVLLRNTSFSKNWQPTPSLIYKQSIGFSPPRPGNSDVRTANPKTPSPIPFLSVSSWPAFCYFLFYRQGEWTDRVSLSQAFCQS